MPGDWPAPDQLCTRIRRGGENGCFSTLYPTSAMQWLTCSSAASKQHTKVQPGSYMYIQWALSRSDGNAVRKRTFSPHVFSGNILKWTWIQHTEYMTMRPPWIIHSNLKSTCDWSWEREERMKGRQRKLLPSSCKIGTQRVCAQWTNSWGFVSASGENLWLGETLSHWELV